MQIVENIGTHVSTKSENVQVTLNNAAEILAVFPELNLKAEEIPTEYDYKTNQQVQLSNQVIIKKCASPTVSQNYDKLLFFIKITSGQDVEIRHYPRDCELMLQGYAIFMTSSNSGIFSSLFAAFLSYTVGRTFTSAMRQ